MKTIQYFLAACLLFTFSFLLAQTKPGAPCQTCTCILQKARNAISGKEKSYENAIKFYNSARNNCPPDSLAAIDAAVVALFDEINGLLMKTEKALSEARKARDAEKSEQKEKLQAQEDALEQESLHKKARYDASLAQSKVDSLTNILDNLKNLYETVQLRDSSINWVERDSMILVEIGNIISQVQTIKNENQGSLSPITNDFQLNSKLIQGRGLLNNYFPQIWDVLLLPSDSISKDTSIIIREFSLILRESSSVSLKKLSKSSIQAIQRMLVFLGYPTSEKGGILIDGDYGSGLNFGFSLFLFENGLIKDNSLNGIDFTRATWQSEQTPLPELKLMPNQFLALLDSTKNAIETNNLIFRDKKMAINNLNHLHNRSAPDDLFVYNNFGDFARLASDSLSRELGISIYPPWLLAVIRQETGGVVRPRFESHLLSKLLTAYPDYSFKELRLRTTSFGLGQILGTNYRTVRASSATDMFYGSAFDQLLYIGRFLAKNREMAKVVIKNQPISEDFHTIGKYYNGPGYAKDNYHEKIQKYFNKYKRLFEN